MTAKAEAAARPSFVPDADTSAPTSLNSASPRSSSWLAVWASSARCTTQSHWVSRIRTGFSTRRRRRSRRRSARGVACARAHNESTSSTGCSTWCICRCYSYEILCAQSITPAAAVSAAARPKTRSLRRERRRHTGRPARPRGAGGWRRRRRRRAQSPRRRRPAAAASNSRTRGARRLGSSARASPRARRGAARPRAARPRAPPRHARQRRIAVAPALVEHPLAERRRVLRAARRRRSRRRRPSSTASRAGGGAAAPSPSASATPPRRARPPCSSACCHRQVGGETRAHFTLAEQLAEQGRGHRRQNGISKWNPGAVRPSPRRSTVRPASCASPVRGQPCAHGLRRAPFLDVDTRTV